MVWEFISALITGFGETILHTAPYLVAIGLLSAALSRRFACNRDVPWWRSPDLVTDLAYWFVVPVFTRFLRIGLLVLGAVVIFDVHGAQGIIDFYENGHGPWAALPFWLQVVLYLVISDFLLYWIHRLFHGQPMWKYHAVHHSSEHVDWVSAARFHPVNLFLGTILVDVTLLLAGIPPAVLGILVPFNVFMSAFVHANLNWTLGPFKYVLASPVFHRWHHTALERGGSKNFAGTFPIIDLMFGTFYMPANALPDAYGVPDPAFPKGFAAQLAYPFKSG
jgi:sterol desaturase/sphingolipid hydroxylase (fatty acid hydroxylase superfamily)